MCEKNSKNSKNSNVSRGCREPMKSMTLTKTHTHTHTHTHTKLHFMTRPPALGLGRVISNRLIIVEICPLLSDERNGGKGQTAIRFAHYGSIKTSKLVYLRSVKPLQTYGKVIVCRSVQVAWRHGSDSLSFCQFQIRNNLFGVTYTL